MQRNEFKQLLSLPVIVAALGYFVDIYDLLLFGIVRVPSLHAIGVPADRVLDEGIFLINIQMTGLLIGGIIWGIFGDKRGRLSVLFGSILLYSVANIANGFVTTVDQYAILRFIAGIGLAGELGAGITLVSEVLPKELRGYGTSLVAGVGMFGAVVAYFVADWFDWRVAYFIGGGLGIALLVTRAGVLESGIFVRIKTETQVKRGEFLKLFSSFSRFKRYVSCILIGLPIWYVIGILIFLSPEIGEALHFPEPIQAGRAVMFSYLGLAFGDISSGLLSQWLKSRKKVVLIFIVLTTAMILLYISAPVKTTSFFYATCVAMGFAVGYWALFVTVAAEQFGTNLRATVTTTVPNFIRGTVPLLNVCFLSAKSQLGISQGAVLVGIGTVFIALIALYGIHETHGKDLNFVEKL
jgi:MFS family permease